MDTSGNAYITGLTESTDFPTASGYAGSYAGNGDVFVTKIDASGGSLVYSTYIGELVTITEAVLLSIVLKMYISPEVPDQATSRMLQLSMKTMQEVIMMPLSQR